MGIIADNRITDDIRVFLEKLSDNIIFTDKINILNAPIDTHPDIQIHFVREDIAVCPPEVYGYYEERLPQGIELIKGQSLGRTYSSHTAYNVARVGNYVICNIKFTDRKIIDFYKKAGYEIINVNQGYAKCNICVLNECAVITEDKGIAKVLSEYDLDVLLIDAGGVRLEGFEYGFIGGASGKIGENIVFTGDIKLHPQFEDILKFFKKHGIIYLTAGNNSLCDYGSLLEF